MLAVQIVSTLINTAKMESSRGKEGKHITVVSPEFCIPKRVHLKIARKLLASTDGNFVVADEKGNVVLEVVERLFSFHDRHVLLDARGTPFVTFKKKKLSAHKRWQAFKGDSSSATDLLFSAKTSSLIQLKTELDVFLSGNKEEISWDFKVVGSWLERSYVVYSKDSTPIAKMHKKHTFGSIIDKDTFEVAVYPYVDYAFIVTIVVMLYEINRDD